MISICIASYGNAEWDSIAWSRAWPSAHDQGAHEVIMEHQPLGDVATSRNAAAEKATGQWLCFLDADDELAPNYIANMAHAASYTKGQRMLFSPRTAQVRNGRRGPARFYPQTNFQTGNWLVIGTLVERDFFLEVGGFRAFAHGLEDWNLWARCIRAGAIVRKVPGAIYIAHHNPQSAHHQLARNREAYMREYEIARKDAWD